MRKYKCQWKFYFSEEQTKERTNKWVKIGGRKNEETEDIRKEQKQNRGNERNKTWMMEQTLNKRKEDRNRQKKGKQAVSK